MPNHSANIYSAPRRFDLATIMVVTIAYALLFSVLRLMRAPPSAIVAIAGFITCVGIGQALLFGGKRPRAASVLAGIVGALGIFIFVSMTNPLLPFDILVVSMCLSVIGALNGYVAGLAVGSVFLISDLMRKSIRRH